MLEILLAAAVAFTLQAIDAGQRELAGLVRPGLAERAAQVGEQAVLPADHQRLDLFLQACLSLEQVEQPLALAALELQLAIDLAQLALQALGGHSRGCPISKEGLAAGQGQQQRDQQGA